MNLYEVAEKFVEWLEHRVTVAGRGDDDVHLSVEPSGKFWLGRLAPEESVIALGLGERGERLDPCAIGIRITPSQPGPWNLEVHVSVRAWIREGSGAWRKSDAAIEELLIRVETDANEQTFGTNALTHRLTGVVGIEGLAAKVRVEKQTTPDGRTELTILLVNVSPDKHKDIKDTNLYQCSMRISSVEVDPFMLEALPDSFRYDRRVVAYGINCGVAVLSDGSIATTDTITADKARPHYWSVTDPCPDMKFDTLSRDPSGPARELLGALRRWGNDVWSADELDKRAQREYWGASMRDEAAKAATEFAEEYRRMEHGAELLERNTLLNRAFRLMNKAMFLAANGRYESWRPFQFGFLLANLASVVDPDSENETADIVWFATGGGKTETYLGLLITAAIYDRLTGKRSGITAWSRFPLRMLSLQQTQRFSDAMAAAEIVRREERIEGEPFSVGFFVGQGATPNSISPDPAPGSGAADPDDEAMPKLYQVLLRCPFCHQNTIEMGFNRRYWRLEHRCSNNGCSWPEDALPFYIVDDEIYRFLPTVVVGTLDKAASISMQAAMRGLVGPPLGKCSIAGHGYVYSPRSKRPNGCLVPGCRGTIGPLDQVPSRFGPSYRLQDELHLLRDSLGAVDAHYEVLYDDLQRELCGRKPKILASSATLTGYEKQVDTLYRRRARVFPLQGPSSKEGFWTSESDRLMRRFVAVAPRGVTLEYAVDRLLTELQTAIRLLIDDPAQICGKIGVDPNFAADLVSLYGTDVAYGNTLRDLDAVMRSLETQVRVAGTVNTASLTGKTDFEEVRRTLNRLDTPEPQFGDRLHAIAASSMMSHGVDIDRLNVMVMLGLPLSTAEFIQATARVGRRWPGLVFVIHKIGRERDAGVYRSFAKYIEQGDRFVEPVPITRRSRRVLERTIAGIELARILAIHEPANSGPLTTASRLREFVRDHGINMEGELAAVIRTLQLDDTLDEPLRRDLQRWFELFYHNLQDPAGTYTFPSDLSPTGGPMRSLRDVEEVAPIHGSYTT